MSEWLTCGERYRLHRIERTPEAPSTWFFSGLAFHAAIEAWERCGRDMLIAEAQDIYRARFARYVEDADATMPRSRWLFGGRWGVDKDLASRLAAGPEWVAAYCAYAIESPYSIWTLPDGEPAVEVPFTWFLDGPDGPIKIVGAIDQVLTMDGRTPCLIRDLKTSTKDPAGARQLGLYRHGFAATYGQRVNAGDYYMAKRGRPTAPIDLTSYDIAEATREFVALETGIKNKIFISDPGDHCRPCSVRYACHAITRGSN